MARAVGIDLGTTNSAIAVLEGGEPTIIPNAEGGRTTPSVVAFSKSGEILVGEIAKRQAVTNVDRTISSVKRHMGTSWSVEIDGKKYTAQEISARILAKLKTDAEAYLGEPVTNAVITVPAYFNDAERQATKEAGTIAGLTVDRIVNEPTAAALAYGLDKGKEDELILVFDLGGGTFDVSLLEVGKDDDGFSTIQVRATNGDNRLGGDDWDARIVDWLVKQVKSKDGVDLSKDKIAMQRLKDAAEQAKKELSSATSTNINLQYLSMSESGPIHLDEKLTRSNFQEMTADLLERTKIPFHNVIKDAGVKVSDIDHVVLVGGSTRVPLVQQMVEEAFGRKPHTELNPDHVVALGAAANLLPGLFPKRWIMAFVFGLVHGLGFASVLADLGLMGDGIVLPLLGFNIGVELGQIAIVLLFVPLAYLARDTALYKRVFVPVGSVAIMVLAGVWLVERLS